MFATMTDSRSLECVLRRATSCNRYLLSTVTIPDSLTIVANYACEESQTPCTLANCRAQDLFPIGAKAFLNPQTALIAKQKAPARFSHGAWNKSPLSQFS